MMKNILMSLFFLLACAVSLPRASAQDEHTPEQIVDGMSVKFCRGIVNMVTCPVELPKQIYTSTRDRGLTGPFVGLLKGTGMTVYRVVCGALETALFIVPAPGFYEPIPRPAYVWEGWARPAPETDGDTPAPGPGK